MTSIQITMSFRKWAESCNRSRPNNLVRGSHFVMGLILEALSPFINEVVSPAYTQIGSPSLGMLHQSPLANALFLWWQHFLLT